MKTFKISYNLITKNFKKIIMFEAIYKLLTTAVFTPLLVEVVNIAMKLAGINYLTNWRVDNFIKQPTTIAIFVLILITFSLIEYFELSAILRCFNLAYNGYKPSVIDMFKYAVKSTLNMLNKGDLSLVIFMLGLIPITHFVALYGYAVMLEVPEFVITFLKERTDLLNWIIIIYFVIAFFVIRWINAVAYYNIENKKFKDARKASAKLNKKHYIRLVLYFLIWHLIIIAIFAALFLIISFVATTVLALVLKYRTAYKIALIFSQNTYNVAITIYSCLIVPISFAILMGYFFARKEDENEEIIVPDYDGKKKKERKKIKRILAVLIILSTIANIAYISSDFGVSGSSLNIQFLNKPKIAAHRGYSSEAPENTLPAFQAAIDNMIDYVELDVQELADGTVIVMHDSSFKRVGGLKKSVWEVNYEDIQDLDVGKWFSDEFIETPVPTLEQVLQLTKGKIKLNIEIKLTGHEKNLEKSVVDLINKYNMKKKCVVTSFQSKALKKVKKYDSSIKTGYILHVAYGDFSKVDFADAISVNYSFASQLLVNSAHSNNMKVYVWTVNNKEAMRNMLDLGVDMIITDDPVMAQETLTSYESNPYVVPLIREYMKILGRFNIVKII